MSEARANRSNETREFRKRLEKHGAKRSKEIRRTSEETRDFATRSEPLDRNSRMSEQGANRSKETRRKKDQRNLEEGANRSKGTREFQKKELTARKGLET